MEKKILTNYTNFIKQNMNNGRFVKYFQIFQKQLKTSNFLPSIRFFLLYFCSLYAKYYIATYIITQGK